MAEKEFFPSNQMTAASAPYSPLVADWTEIRSQLFLEWPKKKTEGPWEESTETTVARKPITHMYTVHEKKWKKNVLPSCQGTFVHDALVRTLQG